MHKNSGKNISKSLSVKHSQQLIEHAEQHATDVLKTTSRREVKKKQQKQLVFWLVTKLLITIQVQKTSQENKLEIITNENDKEIPKTGYIPIE